MVDKRYIQSALICGEMDEDNQNYWFDFKKSKFLHNIDTFYYSVKFVNDFTSDSKDAQVLRFREFFRRKQEILESNVQADFLQVSFAGKDLNLRRCSFAGMYLSLIHISEDHRR